MKKKLHLRKTKPQKRRKHEPPKPKVDLSARVMELRMGPKLIEGSALAVAAAAMMLGRKADD